MEEKQQAQTWLIWLISVLGWFLCAAMCLYLTISLEAWPKAYDFVFPAMVAILFSNIMVFLFLPHRFGHSAWLYLRVVVRACLAEGILLALLYVCGRFFIGA